MARKNIIDTFTRAWCKQLEQAK